jgi:hypothetical protein
VDIYVPSKKGKVTFRLTDLQLSTENNLTYRDYITTIYSRPTYSIRVIGDEVDKITQILVNSNELYYLYLDQSLFSPPEIKYNGTTFWNHTFTNVGEYEIKLKFLSDYLLIDEAVEQIFIYRTIQVIAHNLPERVTEGSNVTFKTQFADNNMVPIEGLTVSIVSYPSNIFNESYELKLGEEVTNHLGEIITVARLIGDEEYIFYKITGDKTRYIKETLIPIDTKVLRVIYLTLEDKEFYTIKDIPLQLTFFAKYEHLEEVPVGVVPLEITISQAGRKIEQFIVESNNQGEYVILIGDNLAPGIYVISLRLNESSYHPLTITRYFQVEDVQSALTNPNNIGLFILGILGIGTAVGLRRWHTS